MVPRHVLTLSDVRTALEHSDRAQEILNSLPTSVANLSSSRVVYQALEALDDHLIYQLKRLEDEAKGGS